MNTNKSSIRYDIIDDVAIGLFIKTFTNIVPIRTASFFQIHPINRSIPTNYIFYRNKSNRREQDIVNMKKIIYLLKSTKKIL